jgi:hypothetical protein
MKGEVPPCCARSGASVRRREHVLVLAARNPERFAKAKCSPGRKVGRWRAMSDSRDRRGAARRRRELDTSASWHGLSIATVVFVGGSLVATGGHNVLEPAVFGKPIVFGPHMENFLEIADAFVSNGAGVQLSSEAELEEAFLSLMSDPVRRARLGAAARALVEANRGANDKSVTVLATLLRKSREPIPPTSGHSDPLLDSLYGRLMQVRAAPLREPAAAPAAPREASDQRREPVDGRHRQVAGGRRDSRSGSSMAASSPPSSAVAMRAATSSMASWSCRTGARLRRREIGRRAVDAARAGAGRDGLRVARSLSRRRARGKARLHRSHPRRRVSAHRAGARSRHARDDDREIPNGA